MPQGKEFRTAIVIAGDAKGAVKAVKLTDSQLRNLNRTTDKSVKKATTLKASWAALRSPIMAAAAATALYGASVARTVNDQRRKIDSLAKMSDQLGITTESLAKLQFAGEQTGVSVDKMGKSLERATRRISEAAQGTGQAKDAIRDLGLSATALNRQSPDKMFRSIAAAMENIPNQSDRLRITMDIFGRAGASLVNTLSAGEEQLDKFAREAEIAGITLDRFSAAKVEAANDAINKMGNAFEGLGKTLTVLVAPPLEDVANYINAILTEGNGVNKILELSHKISKERGLIEANQEQKESFFSMPDEWYDARITFAKERIKKLQAELNKIYEQGAKERADVQLDIEEERVNKALEIVREHNKKRDKINDKLEENRAKNALKELSRVTKARESADELIEKMELQLAIELASGEAKEVLLRKQAKLTAARKLDAGATEEQIQEVKNLAAALFDAKDEGEEVTDIMAKAAERIDEAFANAWLNIGNGFEEFTDGLKDAFKRTLAEMAHEATTAKLFGPNSTLSPAMQSALIVAGSAAMAPGKNEAIGASVGGSIGAFIGGPQGAAAGAQLGAALGEPILGSSEPTITGSELELGVGGSGVFGTAITHEKEKRAVWKGGGTKRRARFNPVSGDLIESANAAIEQAQQVIIDTARQIGIDVSENIFSGFESGAERFSTSGKTQEQIQQLINEWIGSVNNELAELATGSNIQELSQLAAQYDNFFSVFKSRSEQIERLRNTLDREFNALGIKTIPETKEAFEKLVEAQDLQVEKQRETYKSLLELTPQMAVFINALEESGRAIGNLETNITSLTNELFKGGTQANRFREAQAASNSINSTLTSLLFSNDSAVSPGNQLALSRLKFSQLKSAALGGDIDAAKQAAALAPNLIGKSRQVFASSASAKEIFNSVTNSLTEINKILKTVEQPESERKTQAEQLIEALQDYAEQTDKSMLEVAKQFGVDNLENLKTLADLLNVPLTTIDDTLGIKLGEIITVNDKNARDIIAAAGIDLDPAAINKDTVAELKQLSEDLGIKFQDLIGSVDALPPEIGKHIRFVPGEDSLTGGNTTPGPGSGGKTLPPDFFGNPAPTNPGGDGGLRVVLELLKKAGLTFDEAQTPEGQAVLKELLEEIKAMRAESGDGLGTIAANTARTINTREAA